MKTEIDSVTHSTVVPPQNNNVIVGRDHELFLSSVPHETMRYVRGEIAADVHSISILKENISRRFALCRELGVMYRHAVAPDKHSVYQYFFPYENFTPLGNQFIQGGADFIYPILDLDPVVGRTYRQTDSHWSWLGRLIFAKNIARNLGIADAHIDKVFDILKSRLKLSPQKYSGDLGSKLTPVQYEFPDSLVLPWDVTKHSNNIASGNNGRWELLQSSAPNVQGKIVVFGDSFLLQSLPVFTGFFKEILFCRTQYFHDEIIRFAKPDYVVTQNAERYFSSVKSDREAAPFLLLPALLGRPVDISVEAANALWSFLKPTTE